MSQTQRVIAIVGRPNVGKSALFNRIAGRRIAIVHEESGVTRDRLIRTVTWGDEQFELIDTGGVANQDRALLENTIEAGTRSQVDAALQDAAVVIFTVDLTAGALPMDVEVARLLRQSGIFTLLAANKADTPALDSATAEFDAFGFPIFPVSALHNRGIDDLMSAALRALPAGVISTPATALRVAVVGRPNVGKSSYINRLLRSERVIVSDVPGTTRDSIDIPFSVGQGEHARHYVLVDTAGIRRRNKIDTPVEQFSLLRAERTIENSEVVVLMLDAAQGPTAQDKKISSMIQEARRGCLLLVNKWDLQEDESTQRKYLEALARAVPFLGYCPVVFTSAKTGYNIRRSVDTIDHVAAQVRTTLPTGLLNRTLTGACERIAAPAIKGKLVRIFYATQVGNSPIRIRVFVNHATGIPPAYTEYLYKSLRRQFGLEGAPVVIQFESRRRDGDESKAPAPARSRSGTRPEPSAGRPAGKRPPTGGHKPRRSSQRGKFSPRNG